MPAFPRLRPLLRAAEGDSSPWGEALCGAGVGADAQAMLLPGLLCPARRMLLGLNNGPFFCQVGREHQGSSTAKERHLYEWRSK